MISNQETQESFNSGLDDVDKYHSKIKKLLYEQNAKIIELTNMNRELKMENQGLKDAYKNALAELETKNEKINDLEKNIEKVKSIFFK